MRRCKFWQSRRVQQHLHSGSQLRMHRSRPQFLQALRLSSCRLSGVRSAGTIDPDGNHLHSEGLCFQWVRTIIRLQFLRYYFLFRWGGQLPDWCHCSLSRQPISALYSSRPHSFSLPLQTSTSICSHLGRKLQTRHLQLLATLKCEEIRLPLRRQLTGSWFLSPKGRLAESSRGSGPYSRSHNNWGLCGKHSRNHFTVSALTSLAISRWRCFGSSSTPTSFSSWFPS